jgi:hypothetical protein
MRAKYPFRTPMELAMQIWRRRFLLLYMMRVPLLFLAVLGFGLPAAFRTSIFHGVADLALPQVLTAACLASLLVSTAITSSFMILLYGQERADGWIVQPAPQDRVSLWGVAFLYLYGGICWILFLVSICSFMSKAGRVTCGLVGGFLFYSFCGWFLGLLIVMIFFLGALRFAKPENDDALEVFAFPAFLILRKIFGGAWIRSFKRGTRAHAAPGSYAAHNGFFSRIFARLGPGYGTEPTPGHPPVLHSGHRFAMIVMFIFLIAYWLTGMSTLNELRNSYEWTNGGPPNTVLNFLLLVLIFWSGLLAALTFLVDRFRFPVLLVLAVFLFGVAYLGSSDHVFSTVKLQDHPALRTPELAFQNAPVPLIVVAAAGGGIQSAAWTSRVLCGLRADKSVSNFQDSVLAISGVSGGSVGAMFYVRCLEAPAGDDSPATWAQNSSLEAVAWGLTHPDLRRIFFPGPETSWSHADRGWALERSLLKSAHFEQQRRRLADAHHNPDWPVLLLNSTDALTGDPAVFTNSRFPERKSSDHHFVRNFHQSNQGRDVLLETAARMSAAFPYVSPEARPDNPPTMPIGTHLGDGGYFDNSGVFMLSEWLKVAVSTSAPGSKRVLILQLDAFPDSEPPVTDKLKKWYYQIGSPITTMLTVRSEGQIVRDSAVGEDLQKLLNAAGFETTWMLVRYTSPPVITMSDGMACPSDPPLSWHLTPHEKRCIDTAWKSMRLKLAGEVENFLKPPPDFPPPTCEPLPDLPPGMVERRCGPKVPASLPQPARK